MFKSLNISNFKTK
ncbi:hypothetical protein GIX10_01245 [Acinetobacter sp. YIM 103518]|uniref:Uncharacterized protein n=1 Tax=Acinetobacter faecalis TaxID=2665161 RepID=A0A6L6GDW1_9GAMM|nr:hypothetical protein [Acinetobacter faecalis]